MYIDTRDINRVEQKAKNLLQKYKISSLPVPIKDIVKKEGLNLISYDLGENVSGILVIENSIGTIGYSPENSKVRQRFTIAHELGHFLLHKHHSSEVFIDKDFIIKYRSEKKYTSTEIKQEQEANTFAAALLMPLDMLKAEVAKKENLNLSETELISTLAKIFDVSIPAMTYRIANSTLF